MSLIDTLVSELKRNSIQHEVTNDNLVTGSHGEIEFEIKECAGLKVKLSFEGEVFKNMWLDYNCVNHCIKLIEMNK